MKRAPLLRMGIALVFALTGLVVGLAKAGPKTIPVQPGTTRTFRADELVPGDRFECLGAMIIYDPPYGYISSAGESILVDKRGNATVHCPDHFELI